ncbi:amino acid ABC transporter ATP-binding/permease protein [Cellulomonas cellasea]|uniref:Thiol reductant ABC exporter subunit CydC n=1 Tax=Cellulomonas cellasea TaxID=43670 RepID=A0A4Y3L118_9CELL|nr:ATP-binding cassette domain-containing protein [Cellulomonas cellasea]GEA89356.1 thiol reductant ABC exporter subunit CydC [Cellulomonas cellasea]
MSAPTRPWSAGDPLRRALALLDVDRTRVALAVALGVLSLGSAVALAAVAAWLIARASQMPPVLELSVATVAVRAFGIGRGTFRYVERLTSHDVALRGMATLRTTLYERVATGRVGAALALRRGDLLARVGADVDTVGDAVVRGLLPAAVAAVLGVGTAVAMALFLPAAGLALAVCLVLAGVVSPALAARAARTSEARAIEARAAVASVSLGVLDAPGPVTVAGLLPRELDALRSADAALARAVDAGARPAALSAALGQLAVGLAVLAALVLGVPALTAGMIAPVELAVLVLTPLAAFEATAVLPAAAIQVQRSRAAAARVLALLDEATSDGTAPDGTASDEMGRDRPVPVGAAVPGDAPDPLRRSTPASDAELAPSSACPPEPAAVASAAAADAGPSGATQQPASSATLAARDLACGWPGREPVVRGLDLDVRPGRSVAVVGPSGTGKTTLLLTLAGLLPARGGSLTLGGLPPGALPRPEVTSRVVLTTEDAHLFETTVLENLRVARGDVTDDEARAALDRAGLTAWLAGLPDGLATPLGADGRNVSGGERRRLLLARALLSRAPLLLVDEPAEHLDTATADRLVRDLLTTGTDPLAAGPGSPAAPGSPARPGSPAGPPARGVVVVTHRLSALDAADEVLVLRDGRVAARGTHAQLLASDAGYREAQAREQHEDREDP